MKNKEKIRNIIKFTRKIKGWLSVQEGVFLFNAASKLPDSAIIVEIGSYKGRSTIWLSSALENKTNSKVYAIDPHTGSPEVKNEYGNIDTYADFIENIKSAGVENKIIPIRKESLKALKNFDKDIDLLFIDGSHTFEATKEDFIGWSKKLKPGGWMILHDAAVLPGPWKVARNNIFLSRKFYHTGMLGSMVFGRYCPENKRILSLIKNFISYLFAMTYVKMRKIPFPNSWRKRISRANFKHKLGY